MKDKVEPQQQQQCNNIMFAIGQDELRKLPYHAVDLQDENGEFEIIHTHEDGSQEVCKVSSGTDSEGNKLWTIGGYSTMNGKTYLAVVGGKVLKSITLHTYKLEE